MNDFHHQRFNVLVCTTIIETGIDIPTANTIIIERADHFGLAQLHQLRGRVGRSHHQALRLLLTPHPKAMTDAQNALRLSPRWKISAPIRAGHPRPRNSRRGRAAGRRSERLNGNHRLLSYMELLENAVDALKAGREPSLEDLTSQQAEVEPDAVAAAGRLHPRRQYAPVVLLNALPARRTRMSWRRSKSSLSIAFGLLPDPARNLLDIARLRQQAQKLGIRKLESNEKGGTIEFNEKNNVNPVWLIGLLQKQPQHYRLDGPTRLKFMQDLAERKTRMEWVRQFMRLLEENATA